MLDATGCCDYLLNEVRARTLFEHLRGAFDTGHGVRNRCGHFECQGCTQNQRVMQGSPQTTEHLCEAVRVFRRSAALEINGLAPW